MSTSPNSSSSSEPDPPAAAEANAAFTALQDVVCHVDVVLGTAQISVQECLRLRRQSIIRLAQSAGADLKLIVNGVALANGEVVIVDDSTAIRLTDILAPPSSEAA